MNIASASQSRPHGTMLSSRVSTSTAAPSHRRHKFSAERNFVVFPVQLDQRGQPKSPHEAFPFTSYTTIDLKTRHSYDPHLAKDVDNIWVRTASYYKQKQSPQHEFIIFSVTGNNGMENFIALDRNVNVKSSSALISRSGKNGPLAQDYFHVSHYGDMKSLINHCGHTTSEDTCSHVEQVVFGQKSFSFAQLVVMASTISEVCPGYQLGATNCYWFASLIWECIFNLFGDSVTVHTRNSEERGKYKGLKIQGNHGNFQEVVQKYKSDFLDFTRALRDDAMSVVDRRSRRYSTMTFNPPEVEKDTSARAPPTESHRSRRVSTATILAAPDNVPRTQVSNSERDRKPERTRAVSLCPSNQSQERTSRLSASMNKDLPSLPPSASDSQTSRPRPRPAGDSRRNSRASIRESAFLPVSVPDTIPSDHGYSDVGKYLERAASARNRSSSRPVSVYVTPPNQVQPEPSPARITDSTRLKAQSLPSRPNSPGDESNRDRPRSPSLPTGSTQPEKRNSSALTSESSADPGPRKRTTSSIGRLRQALPKLLLPTVSESDDTIWESPEISPWIELESGDYLENHPFSDNASERLSYIEFPQPPGMRVAQGHKSRVHPSRIECADGSRRRRSQSSIGGDSRDSKYSLYGSQI
ncbi:unnamed protein product [Rhizoctonia solani]|uniref:Uncharacterized protein n=1 Tax=Rhizoctonia solani TaxID=456999 RepID=A0A8H3GJZ5_9AGAM|nr:unnamed protein product [Rhizoctonia solani]